MHQFQFCTATDSARSVKTLLTVTERTGVLKSNTLRSFSFCNSVRTDLCSAYISMLSLPAFQFDIYLTPCDVLLSIPLLKIRSKFHFKTVATDMDPVIAPPQSNEIALSHFPLDMEMERHRNALAQLTWRTFPDRHHTAISALNKCFDTPYYSVIHRLINLRREKFCKKSLPR